MRSHTRVVARLAVGIVALMLAAGTVSTSRAQDKDGPQWQPTDLTESAIRLFVPSSGALFAQTSPRSSGVGALVRSDDGGATWRDVPQPPNFRGRVEVDPTDHSILYANAADGLFKSTDEGVSWSLVLPTGEWLGMIAVSAADHNLVYVASVSRVLRSRDGGATWDRLPAPDESASGCPAQTVKGLRLVRPHPSDPARVFLGVDCSAWNRSTGSLLSSSDQGESWALVFTGGLIASLAGGSPSAPDRFYLGAANVSPTSGPQGGPGVGRQTIARRSDDGGQTWQPFGGLDVQGRDPRISSLVVAMDRINPDRIYVAGTLPDTDSEERRLVRASADGGQTWTDLGGGDLVAVGDLALGVDGRSLFAASFRGVWRLPLGE